MLTDSDAAAADLRHPLPIAPHDVVAADFGVLGGITKCFGA